ncbi:hypothetical protein [Streptomyces sp. NPDC047108]|uniref:hypothetical protein n=1 Tax=Streptomyces sp. NPDC047108 TaxID=3155025 RepID=UPI0033C30444
MFGHYVPAGGADRCSDLRRFRLALGGEPEQPADAPGAARPATGDADADADADVGSCTALGLLEMILHAAAEVRDRPSGR